MQLRNVTVKAKVRPVRARNFNVKARKVTAEASNI